MILANAVFGDWHCCRHTTGSPVAWSATMEMSITRQAALVRLHILAMRAYVWSACEPTFSKTMGWDFMFVLSGFGRLQKNGSEKRKPPEWTEDPTSPMRGVDTEHIKPGNGEADKKKDASYHISKLLTNRSQNNHCDHHFDLLHASRLMFTRSRCCWHGCTWMPRRQRPTSAAYIKYNDTTVWTWHNCWFKQIATLVEVKLQHRTRPHLALDTQQNWKQITTCQSFDPKDLWIHIFARPGAKRFVVESLSIS